MSLNSLAQLADSERSDKGTKRYVGVVVDNNDPTLAQRIRVGIPGLLEATDATTLPWIVPHLKSNWGVGDNYGIVNVPRIGSRVWISFQDGDTSNGEYLADVVTTNFTLPSELQTNYPNRIGGISPIGDLWYVDLTSKEFFLRRASGTSIRIDSTGNLEETVVGDFTRYVKGNVTTVVDGNETLVVKGNRTLSVGGTSGYVVSGDEQTQIGGKQSEIVTGTRTISCSSENHSGAINNNADIVAAGVSLINHLTSGVKAGSDTSGPPIP